MPLAKIKVVLEGDVEILELTIDGWPISEGKTRNRQVEDPFTLCITVGGIENTPWKLRVYIEGIEKSPMKGTINEHGKDQKCKKYYLPAA